MSKRKGIGFRMLLERVRNVARSRDMTHCEQKSPDSKSCNRGNNSDQSSADAYPRSPCCHRRAEQQSKRGIDRHRIVFLRRRERKKDQQKRRPAKRQYSRASGTIDRLKTKTDGCRKKHAPRKQPKQVQKPEGQPGHGV